MTLKIDESTISHLSFSSDDGIIMGKALTRGNSGLSSNGETIKAGHIPVIIYHNTTIKHKQRDHYTNTKTKRLQKRVAVLLSNKSKDSSHGTQGNKKS